MSKPIAKDIGLDPKQIYFVPLGGSEQFGVNFNLYAHDGKWLAIDCGMGFADEKLPGIDIVLPDPSFIEGHKQDLSALIITHAHEDHIGAVAHLWPRLKCPIYCTPFTASVLKRKLDEVMASREAVINVVEAGHSIELDTFSFQFVQVSHSIPDAVAVLIETKAGRVFHSGDWNLDPTPVLGTRTDEETIKAIGKKGVLAYIGDSTNAEVPGRTGSEVDVEHGLAQLFKECKGRIGITVFASNIARVQSIVKAAQATDRRVALVGRSLHSMVGSAVDCGYLRDLPDFISEEEIGYLPEEKQVMIVTGSQGEARAALARIARGDHQDIVFGRGDTVIFSSRAIPGNEKEINTVRNNLSAAGVHVISPHDTVHTIHISGHPCRDEVVDMLSWVKPKVVVPVHGERIMLEAQGELARQLQVPHVVIPNNGSVICLGPNKPEVVDHVQTGLLAVEKNRIIDANHASISERRKLQFSGVVHVTLVLNARGDLLADPQVSTAGLVDEDNPAERKIIRDLLGEIEDTLADMQREDLMDDHAVHEEVRIGVRRFMQVVLGTKPKATVHVVRV
ncbi:MAG TPA: ribonuclease J [Micavibrio sp.]